MYAKCKPHILQDKMYVNTGPYRLNCRRIVVVIKKSGYKEEVEPVINKYLKKIL